MSVAVHQPMSIADFLAWEEMQELPREFDGFQPVAMTGGTLAHEVIGGNVRTALQNRFEVLGPSPAHTDRFEKLREYDATPSIQRYVMLEQDRVYVRKSTDLIVETLTADDTLRMPEIDVEAPMAEFYTGVDLTDRAAARAE